ncbi:MAG: tetraacyldisaccharide 4'-kinase [Desulfamplus sp.]|nr:tetraacyldisaccharide 4'-kinase [Desulfamplus sp.]
MKKYYLLLQIEKYLTQIVNRLIQMSDEDFSVKQPFPFNIFRWLLSALSTIYGAAVSLRLWLYRKNILKSRKVPCCVISIGNIVAGGSGKTPMAIYLAEMVKSMGFNPVVVSRGYGGNLNKKKLITSDDFRMAISSSGMAISSSKVLENASSRADAVLVGDGNTIFQSPEVVGDEPFMMASRRSFPVVVGRDRFKAAMMALNLSDSRTDNLSKPQNNCFQKLPKISNIDVIILDDGFQHIQLKRDLDIVLMDYTRPLGNGYLLPAGRLREPPEKAVKRADIVIFTRYPYDDLERLDKNRVEKIVSRKGGFKPFFITRHSPFLHSFLHQTKPFPTNLKALNGRKACLFSGIADNQSFRKTVENLGISVKAHLEFNDHHMYKNGEISMIFETYHKFGADLMVTTEKDYARLSCANSNFKSTDTLNNAVFSSSFSMDFAVIGIEIEFLDRKDEFKALVSSIVQKGQNNSF